MSFVCNPSSEFDGEAEGEKEEDEEDCCKAKEGKKDVDPMSDEEEVEVE